MTRPSALAAAAIAAALGFGVPSTTPASASVLAPPLAAAGVGGGSAADRADTTPASRRYTGNLDGCAADPVLQVRFRWNNADCTDTAPVAPMGRRRTLNTQEECAAEGPVVPVWRRWRVDHDCGAGGAAALASRRYTGNLDGCAADPVMQVGVELVWRRRFVTDQGCAGAEPVVPLGRRIPNLDECAGAGADAVMQVRFRWNNAECAEAGPVVPVYRRRMV